MRCEHGTVVESTCNELWELPLTQHNVTSHLRGAHLRHVPTKWGAILVHQRLERLTLHLATEELNAEMCSEIGALPRLHRLDLNLYSPENKEHTLRVKLQHLTLESQSLAHLIYGHTNENNARVTIVTPRLVEFTCSASSWTVLCAGQLDDKPVNEACAPSSSSSLSSSSDRAETKTTDPTLRLALSGLTHLTMKYAQLSQVCRRAGPCALPSLIRLNLHGMRESINILSILQSAAPQLREFSMLVYADTASAQFVGGVLTALGGAILARLRRFEIEEQRWGSVYNCPPLSTAESRVHWLPRTFRCPLLETLVLPRAYDGSSIRAAMYCPFLIHSRFDARTEPDLFK